MLYRTFAIYSNAKRIRNILIGGYILGVCTTVVILVIISIVASEGNVGQTKDVLFRLTCPARKQLFGSFSHSQLLFPSHPILLRNFLVAGSYIQIRLYCSRNADLHQACSICEMAR
jgi:hypothetical protein